MKNDYIQNIKTSNRAVVQGAQGNTLRCKNSKEELLAYKNRVMTKPMSKILKLHLHNG